MLEYWILVTVNGQGTTVSLYSPDLKKELLGNAEVISDFRLYTRKKLTDYLECENKILLPKKFEQLEDILITPVQHWECFKIKPNKKCGIFEKTLPALGYIFNVTSILTSVFITYMALKIAGNADNKNSSTQSTALAIFGSIFNSLIIFFLYILSEASNVLVETGYVLDNLFRKSDTTLLKTRKLPSGKIQACKLITLSLTAGGCILTNAFIMAVRQYIEFGLLSEKYLKLNPEISDAEYEQFSKLIKWLDIMPNVFATSYCAVAFQGGFARKLIMRFSEKSTLLEKEVRPDLEDSRLMTRFKNVTDELLLSQAGKNLQDAEPLSPEASELTLSHFVGVRNSQSDQYAPLSLDPMDEECKVQPYR